MYLLDVSASCICFVLCFVLCFLHLLCVSTSCIFFGAPSFVLFLIRRCSCDFVLFFNFANSFRHILIFSHYFTLFSSVSRETFCFLPVLALYLVDSACFVYYRLYIMGRARVLNGRRAFLTLVHINASDRNRTDVIFYYVDNCIVSRETLKTKMSKKRFC